VEAAVLTGKVRQSVRTAALVDRDPAAVLALANRALVADHVDTFVTAVCARGRRDGDDLLLDVAAAGHPPPLVVRRDGSVERLEVTGTVLGLLPDSAYHAVAVRLAPGETCVFYTDGVTEAPGHRERFGDERLQRVLESVGSSPVRAQVEALAMALTSHLQDRPHDDIAILAVQARPEPR
jgi:serine phosphatase RsbU (regulator of sigma subunit)